MIDTCFGCKFWRAHYDASPTGECRRFPPQRLGGEGDNADYGFWPDVYHDAWCGEFTARPGKPVFPQNMDVRTGTKIP